MFGYCKGIYVAYSSPAKFSCDWTEYDKNDNEIRIELVPGYYRHGICQGCVDDERYHLDFESANILDMQEIGYA